MLYHRTTAAAARAILTGGFRDGTGTYLTKNVYSGVWLSDIPLGANEGAGGDTLLEVALDLPDAELARFEWVEEGRCFREFLVPAELVNRRGSARALTDEEESALEEAGWAASS